MAKNNQTIVVVKSRKHKREKPHGAWKIAYSDFMTAMMAFFLVMWIMSGLSQAQREGISDYFRTPLKVALVSGDKETASNSAIPGGGDDAVHSQGAVSLTQITPKNYDPNKPRYANDPLVAYKEHLETMVQEDPTLKSLGSQLKIDLVEDGLRIQITDSRQRPMFRLGSAKILPRMREVLEKITPMLNEVPNKMTLTGHTDDLQYASGNRFYSNWELSADRANASRRAMVAAGLDTGKILQVKGAADTMRLENSRPGAPANRRISILVLNERARQRIQSASKSLVSISFESEAPESINKIWPFIKQRLSIAELDDPSWLKKLDLAPSPLEQFKRIIGEPVPLPQVVDSASKQQQQTRESPATNN